MNLLLLFFIYKINTTNSNEILDKTNFNRNNLYGSIKKVFKCKSSHRDNTIKPQPHREFYRSISEYDIISEKLNTLDYQFINDQRKNVDPKQIRDRKISETSVQSENFNTKNNQSYFYKTNKSCLNFPFRSFSHSKKTARNYDGCTSDFSHIRKSESSESSNLYSSNNCSFNSSDCSFLNSLIPHNSNSLEYFDYKSLDESNLSALNCSDFNEKLQFDLEIKNSSEKIKTDSNKDDVIYENFKNIKNSSTNDSNIKSNDLRIVEHLDPEKEIADNNSTLQQNTFNMERQTTEPIYLKMNVNYEYLIISKLKNIKIDLKQKKCLNVLNKNNSEFINNLASLFIKFKQLLEQAELDYKNLKYTQIDLLNLFELGLFLQNIVEDFDIRIKNVTDMVFNKANKLGLNKETKEDPIYVEMTSVEE